MHHTCDFFEFCDTSAPKEDSNDSTYGLIVLNYHLPVLTPHLWTKAHIRLCADGGANRIYDGLPALLPHEDPVKVRERYKPDVIKGDMDSIRPEVKEFYAGLGTIILDESHDQDTTDLHKCVAYIKDSELNSNEANLKVLVVGALGGRFDHELANINVLYTFSNLRIILLSDDSVAFLLPKNCHHEIKINLDLQGPHCGLVPLGSGSKSTTTTGLKWNLDKQAMYFGGLISTSNICEREIVTVFSDADLVWTISTQKLHDWALHQIHRKKNSDA